LAYDSCTSGWPEISSRQVTLMEAKTPIFPSYARSGEAGAFVGKVSRRDNLHAVR